MNRFGSGRDGSASCFFWPQARRLHGGQTESWGGSGGKSPVVRAPGEPPHGNTLDRLWIVRQVEVSNAAT